MNKLTKTILIIGLVAIVITMIASKRAGRSDTKVPETVEKTKNDLDDSIRKGIGAPERGYKGERGQQMLKELVLKQNIGQKVDVADWDGINIRMTPKADLTVLINKGMSKMEDVRGAEPKRVSLERQIRFDKKENGWKEKIDAVETVCTSLGKDITDMTLISTDVDGLKVEVTGIHQ